MFLFFFLYTKNIFKNFLEVRKNFLKYFNV